MQRVGNFADWQRVLGHLDVEQDGVDRDVLLGSEIVPVVNVGGRVQQWQGMNERLAGVLSGSVFIRRVDSRGPVLLLRSLYGLRLTGDTSLVIWVGIEMDGVRHYFSLASMVGTGRSVFDLWVPSGMDLLLQVAGGTLPPVASRWWYCLVGVEVW